MAKKERRDSLTDKDDLQAIANVLTDKGVLRDLKQSVESLDVVRVKAIKSTYKPRDY